MKILNKYFFLILCIIAVMISINLLIIFFFDKPTCEKIESFYDEFDSEIVFPDSSLLGDRFFNKFGEKNLFNIKNESVRLVSKQKSIDGYRTEIVNMELKGTNREVIAIHKIFFSKKDSYYDSLYHFKEIRISKVKWQYLKRMIRNSCFWGKSPHHPKEFNVLCDYCCHSILELKDPLKKNFLGRDYHYIARMCGRNDQDHNLIKDEILSLVANK